MAPPKGSDSKANKPTQQDVAGQTRPAEQEIPSWGNRIAALADGEHEVLIAVRDAIEDGRVANAKEIERRIQKSRSRTNNLLLSLHKKGYLRKHDQGRPHFYELTKHGHVATATKPRLPATSCHSKGYDSPQEQPLALRVHAVQLRFPMLRPPSGDDLASAGFIVDRKMGWPRGTQNALAGVSVNITEKFLRAWLPEIWAHTAAEADEKIAWIASMVAEEFHAMFPKARLGEYNEDTHEVYIRAQTEQTEKAVYQDPIATDLTAKHLRMRTDRYKSDASKGEPELEFHDPMSSTSDVEAYQQLLDDTLDGGWDAIVNGLRAMVPMVATNFQGHRLAMQRLDQMESLLRGVIGLQQSVVMRDVQAHAMALQQDAGVLRERPPASDFV